MESQVQIVGAYTHVSEVKTSQEKAVKEKCMEINTRRSFFSKLAAMAAVITGAPKLFAQQAPPATPPAGGGRRGGGGGSAAVPATTFTMASSGSPVPAPTTATAAKITSR